jgi:hypothetical protein
MISVDEGDVSPPRCASLEPRQSPAVRFEGRDDVLELSPLTS